MNRRVQKRDLQPLKKTPEEVRQLADMAWKEYRDALHNFVLRRLKWRQQEAAEDIVQDIYVQFMNSDLESVRNYQAYLYGIGSNLVKEHLRKQAVREKYMTSTADPLEAYEAAPVDPLHDELGTRLNFQQQFDAAIADLPPHLRQAFLLTKRDGLTYAEAAKRLNCTVRALEEYLHEAKARMAMAVWDC